MDRPQSKCNLGLGLRALHHRSKEAYNRTTPPQIAQGKRDAGQQLITLLGLGLAGGAGVRGLMGLRNMVRDTQAPAMFSAQLPQPITINRRFRNDEEEEENAVPGMAMQKEADIEPGSWTDKIVQAILPESHTTKPLGGWWGPTAGIAAAGGGLYGGYKLVDWLLKKEREIGSQNEVSRAEDEYQEALGDQYNSAMQAKAAGDDLGIDGLADTYMAYVVAHGRPKQAILGLMPDIFQNLYRNNPLIGYDNWEGFKGGTNAMMALAALGTGVGTYKFVKGKSKQELMRKALKKRQQERSKASPPPIYATIGPSEEEGEDELEKTAYDGFSNARRANRGFWSSLGGGLGTAVGAVGHYGGKAYNATADFTRNTANAANAGMGGSKKYFSRAKHIPTKATGQFLDDSMNMARSGVGDVGTSLGLGSGGINATVASGGVSPNANSMVTKQFDEMGNREGLTDADRRNMKRLVNTSEIAGASATALQAFPYAVSGAKAAVPAVGTAAATTARAAAPYIKPIGAGLLGTEIAQSMVVDPISGTSPGEMGRPIASTSGLIDYIKRHSAAKKTKATVDAGLQVPEDMMSEAQTLFQQQWDTTKADIDSQPMSDARRAQVSNQAKARLIMEINNRAKTVDAESPMPDQPADGGGNSGSNNPATSFVQDNWKALTAGGVGIAGILAAYYAYKNSQKDEDEEEESFPNAA